jgi:hypothetical protein
MDKTNISLPEILPAEMVGPKQWVGWKYVTKEGSTKPTKVPLQAWGQEAKTDDPATWTTFQSIAATVANTNGRFDGIGFVFTPEDPYAGIDLDNCLAEDGSVMDWAQPLLARFADTYAEVSPSGRGIKIFCQGKLQKGRKIEFYVGGVKRAVEAYSSGRFFTVTGRRWQNAPFQITPHQADIETALEIADKLKKTSPAAAASDPTGPITEGNRHEALKKMGIRLRVAGLTAPEIEAGLLAFNAHRCSPPKSKEEIRDIAKWVADHRFDGTVDPVTAAQKLPIFTYRDVPSVWDFTAEMRYIIPDLLPEAAITLYTGDSGHGKSLFATGMAGAIVRGGSFLDRQCVRRKVLYLDRENPLALVKKHLLDLHIERTSDLIYWGLWCEQPPDGPGSESLRDFARAEKPVLIFDSLIAFHSGDEQDASETRRYLQYIRDLAAAGATIILLHHIGKSENAKQYRGSSDIKASVDTAWLLEKLGDPAGLLSQLRLVPFKDRIGAGKTIPIKFQAGQFLMEQRAESNREIFERIVRTNPNSTGTKIVKLGMAADLGKTWIEQQLLNGVQQDWLQIKSGKRNAKLYSLKEPTLGEI